MATATASSPNVLHKFLSAPELVLIVLAYLPDHDLLAVSRANKYLRAVIRESNTLVSRLSYSPNKHYSDYHPYVWNLANVHLNSKLFPHWQYGNVYCNNNTMACMEVPDHRTPAITLKLWRSAPREKQYLDFAWLPHRNADQSVVYDPVRSQYLPLDQDVRALFLEHADHYPTEPPLPTINHCHNIPVSRTQIQHTNRNPGHDYSSVSVDVKLGPCTFGDMVKVSIALSRSPPKVWNASTAALEWCPREEYPELLAESDFKEAINLIQDWPVMYKS